MIFNVIRKMDIDDLKEQAIGFFIVRIFFLLFSITKYLFYYYVKRNLYLSLSTVLRYERILLNSNHAEGLKQTQRIASKIRGLILKRRLYYLSSFQKTKESIGYRKEFLGYGTDYAVRLKYPKHNDDIQRQGDLLILKPYLSRNEKGLIFLQYNDSFKKFATLFNINAISQKYRFVLEPSWWGYIDPVFFLYFGLDTDVIIEAQHEDDFKFINNIRHNLHAIRLGAGDWVDSDLFNCSNSSDKVFDIVMVANWLKLKRHRTLFRAISNIKNKIGRVALIGYPRQGRTIRDIQKEATEFGVLHKIEFFENIPPKGVNKILQRSKFAMMLSKREGANRGIYESFFCDVPVILTSHNTGVNRDHINKFTGIFSSDNDLSDNIVYMLENYSRFSPRSWALKNTGYINSHAKLNSFIKDLSIENHEKWTMDIFPKKNAANAIYVQEHHRLIAEKEFGMLKSYLEL